MSGKPRRKRSARASSNAGWAFILPFFLLFIFALVVPLGYALYSSLFKSSLRKGTTFAGLENYRQAIADPILHEGTLRVLRFFLLQVPLMLLFALLFALALDSGRLRFMKTIRLAIFLPYAVPSVVAALMWGYLYGREFGIFNDLSNAVGLPSANFLGDRLLLSSFANIQFWEFAGYNMIILFAALRAIPHELYEAAAIDGAGAWRIATAIKLPALRPALMLTLLFSVVGSLQLFNEPLILTRAIPTVLSHAGYTPNYYAFNVTFKQQDENYAAAISFVLAFVILVTSYTVLLITKSRTRKSAS